MATSSATKPSPTKTSEKTITADLNAQLDSMRSDLADLVEKVSGLASSTAEDAVLTARINALSAGDALVDHAETAGLHALEVQDNAVDFVRRNPGLSLGVAAGVGVLIGALVARKS